MTTPLTVASRQTLAAQIITLDFQIDRLTKLFNAASFKTGSLMLSALTERGKDFNELIVWRDQIPFPTTLIRDFLQAYNQHLIYQRNNCAVILDDGETTFQESTRNASCTHCRRHTLQRNYFIITGSAGIAIPTPLLTWVCNECESIIKEGQP